MSDEQHRRAARTLEEAAKRWAEQAQQTGFNWSACDLEKASDALLDTPQGRYQVARLRMVEW